MDGIKAREFRNFIEENGLVDLGSIGSRFTWCNNRCGGDRVWKWIDITFAIADCFQMYPRYQVQHPPRIAFNHRPMLITTEVSLPLESIPV